MKTMQNQYLIKFLSLGFVFISALLVLSSFLTKKAEVSKATKGVNFYGFQEGYDLAVNESKPLLIDMYTDWCGYCRKMDKHTYSDPEVIALINENFIPVKFNPEQDGKFAVGKKIMTNTELKYWLGNGKVYGYPSTYFWMEPHLNNKIKVEVGYKDKKNMVYILKNYLGMHED